MSSFEEAIWVVNELKKNGIGFLPKNMRSFSARQTDSTSIGLRFLEPNNTVVDGEVLLTIVGVKIQMRDDRYPENPYDGTTVVDNKNLGAYENTDFIIGDLEQGKTYYFSCYPYVMNEIFNTSNAPVNRTSLLVQRDEMVTVTSVVDEPSTFPYATVNLYDDTNGKVTKKQLNANNSITFTVPIYHKYHIESDPVDNFTTPDETGQFTAVGDGSRTVTFKYSYAGNFINVAVSTDDEANEGGFLSLPISVTAVNKTKNLSKTITNTGGGLYRFPAVAEDQYQITYGAAGEYEKPANSEVFTVPVGKEVDISVVYFYKITIHIFLKMKRRKFDIDRQFLYSDRSDEIVPFIGNAFIRLYDGDNEISETDSIKDNSNVWNWSTNGVKQDQTVFNLSLKASYKNKQLELKARAVSFQNLMTDRYLGIDLELLESSATKMITIVPNGNYELIIADKPMNSFSWEQITLLTNSSVSGLVNWEIGSIKYGPDSGFSTKKSTDTNASLFRNAYGFVLVDRNCKRFEDLATYNHNLEIAPNLSDVDKMFPNNFVFLSLATISFNGIGTQPAYLYNLINSLYVHYAFVPNTTDKRYFFRELFDTIFSYGNLFKVLARVDKTNKTTSGTDSTNYPFTGYFFSPSAVHYEQPGGFSYFVDQQSRIVPQNNNFVFYNNDNVMIINTQLYDKMYVLMQPGEKNEKSTDIILTSTGEIRYTIGGSGAMRFAFVFVDKTKVAFNLLH